MGKSTINLHRQKTYMTPDTKTPAHSPLPWKVATNPGGPENQPAFPHIVDATGEAHGMDIVAMPLGNSETVKANAALIARIAELEGALRPFGEFFDGLEHVGGDTLVAPTFKIKVFKDARQALNKTAPNRREL